MQPVRLFRPMKVGERSVHPQGSHQEKVVAGVFARHKQQKPAGGPTGFTSLTKQYGEILRKEVVHFRGKGGHGVEDA